MNGRWEVGVRTVVVIVHWKGEMVVVIVHCENGNGSVVHNHWIENGDVGVVIVHYSHYNVDCHEGGCGQRVGVERRGC